MDDYRAEFQALAEAYRLSGGNVQNLENPHTGILLVSGGRLLGKNEIPGLVIQGEEITDGVRARILVQKEVRLQNPVHLCFGVISETGVQRIVADFVMEQGSSARFLAHCSFPNAVQVRHLMEGTVHVGRNATFTYEETHYHGERGGVEVIPKMKIIVAEDGIYMSQFKLIQGSAGVVDIDYKAEVNDRGLAEMEAKIYGKSSDQIRIKESLSLNGRDSRGLAKTRVVVKDRAKAEVLGEIIGKGPSSRGHVDCMEIIQGNEAQASAVPRLLVLNDTAKLTHEAAIGSVDKKQMQTLMARGLSEQEAVDVIVKGLLK